jgi:hypothetical protein
MVDARTYHSVASLDNYMKFLCRSASTVAAWEYVRAKLVESLPNCTLPPHNKRKPKRVSKNDKRTASAVR